MYNSDFGPCEIFSPSHMMDSTLTQYQRTLKCHTVDSFYAHADSRHQTNATALKLEYNIQYTQRI